MSNSVATSQSANTLLSAAAAPGALLTQAAYQTLKAVDYGQVIANGMGISADLVTASETVLVSALIDDSTSIGAAGNTNNVIKGHNMIIDSLQGSKQRDGVLFYSAALNSGLINPFNLLDQATRLDNSNYSPRGSTPLYDRAAQTLATVVAKVQEFEDNAQPSRSITVIVTDGCDVGSREATAASVGLVVKDLLAAEMHIVAAVGIDDGSTDFRKVFAEMGIPDQWILTPGNTESEIRQAFQVISQRVSQASQGGKTGFSNVAAGGFGVSMGGFGI